VPSLDAFVVHAAIAAANRRHDVVSSRVVLFFCFMVVDATILLGVRAILFYLFFEEGECRIGVLITRYPSHSILQRSTKPTLHTQIMNCWS